MIVDHIGLVVRDYQASKKFYLAALAPLGITMVMEVPVGDAFWAGMGRDGKPEFWFGEDVSRPANNGMHIAFDAPNREAVHAFYDACLAAGGQDNGAPGPRDYHPDYYGAFIMDLNGHNIEAVCHKAP